MAAALGRGFTGWAWHFRLASNEIVETSLGKPAVCKYTRRPLAGTWTSQLCPVHTVMNMEHECNTNVKILTFVFILIRSGKHPYSSQVVRIDSCIVRIVFGSSWREHECILLFKTFVLVRVHIRIRTEFVAHSACSYSVLVVIRVHS